ncbi:MAG: sulfotransferase, partial [Woeseiaceae bacterium]|nr:sulfotransferase [Woeseiaceae bacterium]
MVRDLEGEVQRLLQHCGLPFEDACLQFHNNRRPVNTASAEQVRQPVYSDAVGYWKNYEPHLAELKHILEPVLL